MLIDDDRDVLNTLTKGLQLMGFNVHAFADPVAALAHVEAGCHECELAVCDVHMPKMSGFQLARRLWQLRPELKIIFMTAFETSKKEFELVLPPIEISDVIRKPFAPSKLVEIVKNVYLNEPQKNSLSR